MARQRFPWRKALVRLAIVVVLLLPIASPFVAVHRRCGAPAAARRISFLSAEEGNEKKAELTTGDGASTGEIVIAGIESTPNPSSFLIQLENPLPGLEFLSGSLRGATYHASKPSKRKPPEALASMLRLEHMDFVFAMPTVLTINKKPSGSWEALLPSALESLLEKSPSKRDQLDRLLREFLVLGAQGDHAPPSMAAEGTVKIRVQTAGGIPIQVEAKGCKGAVRRRKLSQPKFQRALDEVKEKNPSFDFFGGRVWTDKGLRYLDKEDDEETKNSDGEDPLLAALLSSSSEGDREQKDIDTVLTIESEEIDAAYPPERLQSLVAGNCPDGDAKSGPEPVAATTEMLPPEKIDLAAVDAYCDASEEGDASALQALVAFVKSRKGKLAARRNALAFLGGTAGMELEKAEQDAAFQACASALQLEKSPAMRRTAGDALSDLGRDKAVPYAIESLQTDRSQLVRWRAARILGELAATEDARDVLELSQRDDTFAFEVAFEIKDALRKVRARLDNKNGDVAAPTGPMWKQIQEGTKKVGKLQ